MEAGPQAGFDDRAVAVQQVGAHRTKNVVAHHPAPQPHVVHQEAGGDAELGHGGDVLVVQQRGMLGAVALGRVPARQLGR